MASENERGRQWGTAASTAFESIENQDSGGSGWDLLGTCCKRKHDHRLGCRSEGIGCVDGTIVAASNVLSEVDVKKGKASSELEIELEDVRQHIDCALCAQPGTVAACLKCALSTCEMCMNPNGKCIGCHNPWGTLTSDSGDDAPDTDVEARHRSTEEW